MAYRGGKRSLARSSTDHRRKPRGRRPLGPSLGVSNFGSFNYLDLGPADGPLVDYKNKTAKAVGAEAGTESKV